MTQNLSPIGSTFAGSLTVAPISGRILTAENFAGSGAITVSALSGQILTAQTLAGTGALTATAISGQIDLAETFAGTGALIVGAGELAVAAATLRGSGSILATPISGAIDLAETFHGSGALVATGQLVESVQASLSGIGSLLATAQVEATATATLQGSGALAAALVALEATIAAYAGAGLLTVTAISGQVSTAEDFAGSGALSATAVLGETITPPIAGAGALSASGGILATTGANLQGSGSLFADVTVRAAATYWQISAAFGGAGNLKADATGGTTVQPDILGGTYPHRRWPILGAGRIQLPGLTLRSEIVIVPAAPPIEAQLKATIALWAKGSGAHGVAGDFKAKLPWAYLGARALVQAEGRGRARLPLLARAAGRYDHFTDEDLASLAPWLMLGD